MASLHQEKIDFIKKLLKATKTYSLSERKIAVQLTQHFKLNPEMTYYLMNQWIAEKIFYRTVHRSNNYCYARWSFKFNQTQKGDKHALPESNA